METLIAALGAKQDLLHALIVGFLIFVRLTFSIFFTPFFGGRTVAFQIKVAAALALMLIVFPGVSASMPKTFPITLMTMFPLFLKEVFVGLTIGLMMSMIFFGIQASGQFIDSQRGVSVAAIFNPALGSQATITANFMYELSVVLFFILGGHFVFINAIFSSFAAIPLFAYPNVGVGEFSPTIALFTKVTVEVMLVALGLSSPVIISMFLAEVVLGISNRVAPQMDVQFMSYTVKAVTALIILFVSMHYIFQQMAKLFEVHLGLVYQMIDLMKPVP